MTASCEIAARQELPGFVLDLEMGWSSRAVAIFGPSGAGKSSLLEILSGVRRADSARIVLYGRLLEDSAAGVSLAPERRHLGWVPQDAALFPHLTVEENVRYGTRRGGGPAPGRAPSLERAIEMLEIGRLLERRPAELSGGERQRVAFARALARDPAALLLDEPLASLDLPLRARIFPYLLRMRQEADVPILYVTHDAGEALALADHVVVLEGGRCVAAGPPEQLLRTPATLRLLDLLRLENRLVVATAREQPERGWTAIEIEGGLRIAGPAGAGFREGEAIGIRAEDILVAREKPGAISARNILPARLLEMQDEGERILLSLESSGVALRATITRDAAGDLALAPGQGVWLVFKAQAVHRLIE
ncbi:MAG: molybdenum ABC transporter ATP-binding protein [Candidatus Eisenbacteria bacterium]